MSEQLCIRIRNEIDRLSSRHPQTIRGADLIVWLGLLQDAERALRENSATQPNTYCRHGQDYYKDCDICAEPTGAVEEPQRWVPTYTGGMVKAKPGEPSYVDSRDYDSLSRRLRDADARLYAALQFIPDDVLCGDLRKKRDEFTAAREQAAQSAAECERVRKDAERWQTHQRIRWQTRNEAQAYQAVIDSLIKENALKERPIQALASREGKS